MSLSHPVSGNWRCALASGAAALAVALMLGAPSGPARANGILLTGCGGAMSDFGADCSLGELIANSGSIAFGDKLFTGFANFSSQSTSGSIPPVDPATISVLPISMGGELGLEFTPTPSINTSSLSNLGATFRYFVLVTDAGLRISDNTLWLSDAAGAATASASCNKPLGASCSALTKIVVNEHVRDLTLSLLADPFKQVFVDAAGGSLLSDHRVYTTAVGALRVDTGFSLLNREAIAEAQDVQLSLTSFRQTFSQISVSVPEPASLALFAAGLLGLGFLRRRRARAEYRNREGRSA